MPTEHPADRFVVAITALARFHRFTLEDGDLEDYAIGLGGVMIEDIERACLMSRGVIKFMPKPSELRELAVGTLDEQALRAFAVLGVAVGRVGRACGVVVRDPALMQAVRSVFGSWPGVCEARDAGEIAWQGRRKEFLACYRAALLRPTLHDVQRPVGYLPGALDSDVRTPASTRRAVGVIAGGDVTASLAKFSEHGQIELDSLTDLIRLMPPERRLLGDGDQPITALERRQLLDKIAEAIAGGTMPPLSETH